MIVLIWSTSSGQLGGERSAHAAHVNSKIGCSAKAAMTTAFYSHPDCRRHDMGRGHPECPQRLDAITTTICSPPGLDVALEHARGAAGRRCSDVGSRTAAGYVAELQRPARSRSTPTGEPRALDPDTVAGPAPGTAVLRAAGAAVAATDAVHRRRRSRTPSARCARPATTRRATRRWASASSTTSRIAARHALDVRGLQRVAIVDFDVHHGNGTEDIIAGDERVLMVEHLPAPALPVQRRGAEGTNMVNVPVPPYTAGPEIRALIEANWMPRARGVPAAR